MRRRIMLPLLAFLFVPLGLDALEVQLTPPEGARFAPGQRFDVRAQVTLDTGESLAQLEIWLDGSLLLATKSLDSGHGATVRNRSVAGPGSSELVAVVTLASGESKSVRRSLDIVPVAGTKKPLRNVIFLLGDGMGTAHRTAARIVRYGYEGGRPRGLLAMDRLPVTGMVMTASLDSVVTDSAPGMSSYMTGNKATNSQEGVFPDGADKGSNTDGTAAFDNPRVEYLSSYLHRFAGKSLGVVTTADVEDATPAAAAVHTANRDNGAGICDQFLDERDRHGLTVLMGGGRRWFLPNDGGKLSSREAKDDYEFGTAIDSQLGLAVPSRKDPARKLLEDFKKAGFRAVLDKADMDIAMSDLAAGKTFERLLGLFAYGHMNVAYDKIVKRRNPGVPGVVDDYRAPDQPMLDEMAAAALRVLERNANGFVLVIEGASIDKQSHMMDADRAIWDTLEFDRAVALARRYADQHGDTLVVVTADHETAGFSVIGAADTKELAALGPDNEVFDPKKVPARQTAVKVYEAARFPQYEIEPDGYPKIDEPLNKLLVSFGAGVDRFEGWLAKPLPVIDSSVKGDILANLEKGTGPTGKKYPSAAVSREESAHGFFLRGSLPGRQAAHTGADIVLSAYGGPTPEGAQAAARFGGYQENTDIFFKILRALLGGY
jgi:alkaline phosphatase